MLFVKLSLKIETTSLNHRPRKPARRISAVPAWRAKRRPERNDIQPIKEEIALSNRFVMNRLERLSLQKRLMIGFASMLLLLTLTSAYWACPASPD
ncbi:hypothetical protein, partial [Bordetella hinzii]|uniref:hypothetical protein n=1 Tax=Bordetella hinzii TaxID=103855 RepID=UPI001E2B389E